MSPTDRHRHCHCHRHVQIVGRLRRALEKSIDDSDHAAYQDMNVIHGLTAYVPGLFVAPEDDIEHVTEDGLGLRGPVWRWSSRWSPPGHRATERDPVRKRRAYARTGVPVYVLIGDHDGHGTVTGLTSPSPSLAAAPDAARPAHGPLREVSPCGGSGSRLAGSGSP
ncbi:Uma2 family endonuclease [Streptomyces sp. CNQ085]|uniref:Uma2 family endonuclease n=1 Tax=Streptomyces sp. CNQ085 TaxID=2886944 RepID=UPI001F50EE28|nr:Uma2 family endonuclease [Streptomyces sp. CNQ085]MCI0385206.1 Uma2 family endonuclease [Streptomyces sp. CNQ085]